MEQVRKKKEQKPPPQEAEVAPNPQTVDKGAALKAQLEGLIEEIESVLEENAEEFVKSYVQRGGE